MVPPTQPGDRNRRCALWQIVRNETVTWFLLVKQPATVEVKEGKKLQPKGVVDQGIVPPETSSHQQGLDLEGATGERGEEGTFNLGDRSHLFAL